MDGIRRIVSGKKARFTDGELDLDLVQLTDRVILMGYPASGLAALYRNQRKDVHKFLQQYAPENKFRIVNLCPRYENSYDGQEFDGRVFRHPFPDHFPPPLSMIPVFVHRANSWMNQDEDNLLIIHCKAGKGRSGTFGVCYLLAQPGLPSAPPVTAVTPNDEAVEPSVPAIDSSAVQGTSDDKDLPMSDKISYLLDFHTKRRMAPGTTSRGVSIASQRRWIGYWGRLLEGQDPRPKGSLPYKPLTSNMRRMKLEWVKILGPGPSGVTKTLGGDRIAVQVLRYRDSIATSLREKELALANGRSYDYDDDEWDDRSENMIVPCGGLSEDGGSSTGSSTPERSSTGIDSDGRSVPASPVLDRGESTSTSRTLLPHTAYLEPSYSDEAPLDKAAAVERAQRDSGIILDGDREVQLKILLGKSGRKHSALPAMAALGIIWFIPSFESNTAMSESDECVLRVEAGEIDFLKPQAHIEAVEIGWRWLDPESAVHTSSGGKEAEGEEARITQV